jgi:hypothetical protein
MMIIYVTKLRILCFVEMKFVIEIKSTSNIPQLKVENIGFSCDDKTIE